MTFPNDFEWRLPITAQAAQVESNESNFPYYYDLSNADASFWANVQSDGGDIRITSDEAGSNRLPLEVVFIDTSAQTGQIHFKDSTDNAANKTYYLWFRASGSVESQPLVTDIHGRNAVWSSYTSKYHLEGTTGAVIDSTGNHDGTNNGATRGVVGQVGNAFSFNGTSNYVQSNAAFASMQMLGISVKPDVTSGARTTISVTDSTDKLYFRITINSGNATGVYTTAGVKDYSLTGNSVPTSSYTRIVFGNDGTTLRLYQNGVEVASLATPSGTGTGTSPDSFTIGGLEVSSGVVQHYDGIADEAFFKTGGVFSAGWVKTEFNMLDNNGTFWSTGTSEEITSFTMTTNAATNLFSDQATLNGEVSDFE